VDRFVRELSQVCCYPNFQLGLGQSDAGRTGSGSDRVAFAIQSRSVEEEVLKAEREQRDALLDLTSAFLPGMMLNSE
jgi:hypothetical protein